MIGSLSEWFWNSWYAPPIVFMVCIAALTWARGDLRDRYDEERKRDNERQEK